jgi:hypothetical protein
VSVNKSGGIGFFVKLDKKIEKGLLFFANTKLFHFTP